MAEPKIIKKNGYYHVKHNGKIIVEKFASVDKELTKDDWKLVSSYCRKYDEVYECNCEYVDKKRKAKVGFDVKFFVLGKKICHGIEIQKVDLLDKELNWLPDIEGFYQHRWIEQSEVFRKAKKDYQALVKEINKLPQHIKTTIYDYYEED